MALNLLNRLEYIDYLIRSKKTGRPEALAEKLGLSERSLYNLLNDLKSFDAPIRYDKNIESYYYEYDGDFSFRFKKSK